MHYRQASLIGFVCCCSSADLGTCPTSARPSPLHCEDGPVSCLVEGLALQAAWLIHSICLHSDEWRACHSLQFLKYEAYKAEGCLFPEDHLTPFLSSCLFTTPAVQVLAQGRSFTLLMTSLLVDTLQVMKPLQGNRHFRTGSCCHVSPRPHANQCTQQQMSKR